MGEKGGINRSKFKLWLQKMDVCANNLLFLERVLKWLLKYSKYYVHHSVCGDKADDFLSFWDLHNYTSRVL